MMVNLADLRWEHSMRNLPLSKISAEMRLKNTQEWVKINGFTICGMSFNELTPCWIDSHDFQARFQEKSLDRPSFVN